MYKQIAEDLAAQIRAGVLRPGDRVSSEHELAEQYSVSVITTKSALNTLADQGVLVRKRGKGSFVAPAEALQSLPEFSAVQPGERIMRAKTIGVILPSMKTRVDQQLLDALERELAKTDYLLALCITREDQAVESAAIHAFIQQGVSGLIIFPAENETYNEDILKLSYDHFPFVFVDRYLKGIRANSVVCENFESTRRLVGGLLEKGGSTIAFLSPKNNNSVTADRRAGFERAFAEHSLLLREENYCFLAPQLTTPQQKEQTIYTFLKQNPTVDTLFCVNQEISTYVYHILQKEGELGRYSLYAFDNPGYPCFSYIRQDLAKTAGLCVSILLETIGGNDTVRCLAVPAALVEKDEG